MRKRGVAARSLAAGAVLALALLPGVAGSQQPDPAAPAAKKGEATAAEPAGPPQLDARAWILVDPRDDAVLAAKAGDRRLPIASATKLMTAYLALKKLKPKQTLAAAPYKALAAESLLGLRAGEKVTVKDLLYALMLPSANDAAETLAVGVGGTVPRFVAQMNRQANALGLDDTSYATPVGLDDPDNFSSAADLVTLATVLLENPLFARIVDTETTTLQSGDRPRRITSRNTLLGRDPSVDGVKTGHTIQAGYVLVGSATRDGTRLVSAVLGARSEAGRDAETLKLLDYGFSLYRPSSPVAAGEELADPKLDYRDDRLPLVARRGVEVSAREGQAVETEVDAPEELSGEIEEGEPLGEVLVTVDGREADRVPLVASESAEAATLTDKTVGTAQNPLILIPAGLAVILVGVVLATRGRGSEESEPAAPRSPTRRRERGPQQRTPEERRKMHEERMRKRKKRPGEGGGSP
jgi:D-alanyl-D-alanine carboxypeptidase (penicillin-binding protein 5/6)